MRNIATYCILVALVLISACGGGTDGDDIPTPPVVELLPFSLKLHQENRCGNVSPLSGATILIYDGSPNVNPEGSFESYITGTNGLLELDLEEGSKVSFSIISNSVNDVVKVYSFIDLSTDNYDFTMLHGDEAFTNSACSCLEKNVDAEVVTGHQPDEYSYTAQAIWGNNVNAKYAAREEFSNLFTFTDVEICGEDYKELPLIVAVSSNSNGGEYLAGKRYLDTLNDLDSALQVDSISSKKIKPELGPSYGLTHKLLINNNPYLTTDSGPTAFSYYNFEELNVGKHYFSGTYEIESTYNGEASSVNNYVYAGNYRRSIQASGDANLMGTFSASSSMGVIFDNESRAYTIEVDGIENFDLKFFTNYYTADNGSSIRWVAYSPNVDTTYLPKLNESIENLLVTATHDRQFVYISDMDDENDFSSALKNRIFNNAEGKSPYATSERLLVLLQDSSTRKEKDRSYIDLLELESTH